MIFMLLLTLLFLCGKNSWWHRKFNMHTLQEIKPNVSFLSRDGIFIVTWEELFLCATSGLEVVSNARGKFSHESIVHVTWDLSAKVKSTTSHELNDVLVMSEDELWGILWFETWLKELTLDLKNRGLVSLAEICFFK